MIKRMNKVTSLLVAAAAVISLAPISGVNAAEKLETKEGTVDEAVAFDGGYIYDGYKTDADETGVYYNTGDADKLVEDLHSDEMTEYGTKYAKVKDGSGVSDFYLVDLTTGKVLDENIDDIKDSVTTKLKSALNKTDRYANITTTNIKSLNEIVSGQFAENWFEYAATTSAGATIETALHGYVNEAGKYIDTDVTANIYVINGEKVVKVQDFDKENKDYHVTVSLDSAKTIAEDKDYIYRIATVNVSTTDAAATYIQKISKAQGADEDGAFLPNTVASYEITNAFDSEDADKANETFADLKGTDGNYTGVDFRVINGVVYATRTVEDKVVVTTFKLKKDKVAIDAQPTVGKVDTYLVEQDVNEDQTVMGPAAVAIDAEGNTWALNKGEIFKFNGTEFTTVYNCDRAMNSLNVYNQNNLIAWEDGKDAYAVVGKKTTETPVETPVTTKGWVKTASGWTFFKADGSQVKGQWVNDGGVWYMIKADGIMATGWYNDNGTWYFLNASGAMKTGWVNDNGTWYYLNGSGAMKTGWVNDNGTWYYLNTSGAMLSNTVVDGYKLGASGAWVK